jgi:translocation and assembly module TamB
MKTLTRLLLAALALAIVFGVALAGGAVWLLYTERGTAWVLDQAHARSAGKLMVEGAQGVLGKELFVERLVYEDAPLRLEVRGLRTRVDLSSAFFATLALEVLRADSLTLALPPGDGKTPTPPERLALPIGLRVDAAFIHELTVARGDDRYALRDLAFAYEGGARRHRIEYLHTESPWGRIALNGEIANTPPYALTAAASLLRPDPDYPIGAGVELRGNLQRVIATLTGSVSMIPAEARLVLMPFSTQPLQSLNAQAGPVDLVQIDARLPRTALTLKLEGKAAPERRLAGTLSAQNAQAGALDLGRLPLTRLDARFATDFARVRLDGLRLSLPGGGSLSGAGELSAQKAELALRAEELDLRAFRSTLRETRLAGPLQLSATPERQALKGQLSQENLSVSADILRVGDSVEIRALRASANGGTVAGTGRLNTGAGLAFQAKLALAGFDPAQFGDYPEGSINGTVNAEGRLGDPRRVNVQWRLARSEFRDYPLNSQGSARIAAERVSAVDAQASLGTAKLSARGAFGARGDELAWTLDAPRLAELSEEIAGSLRASGVLSGNWNSPRVSLSAQARALQLEDAISVKSLTAKASLGKSRDSPLSVTLDAQGVDLQTLQLQRLALSTSGTLAQHEAALSAHAANIDLDTRVRGSWHEQGRWTGDIQTLRNRGLYPLQLVSPAPLEISRQHVRLAGFDATLGQGRLRVREADWTPQRVTSSGDFSALPAVWLLVPAGLGEKLRSTLLLDGAWSVNSTPKLNGTLSVRRSGGDIAVAGEGAPIALDLQRLALDARFVEGRIDAGLDLASRLVSLALDGQVSPTPGAQGLGIDRASPVAFKARLTLAELRVFSQSLLTQARVDGRISATLRGSGTLGEPLISGDVRGESLALDVPPYGVYLKDGELSATLEGDTLQVRRFAIAGGEGRFTASGAIPLRLADGGAKLEWRAQDLRVLNRPDMRLVVNGNGTAGFNGERFALSGELRAREGFFDLQQDRLPDLGDDVVVVGRPRETLREKARVPMALDMQLDLGDKLIVQGLGLDGRLSGRLHVTDRDGELRAEGRIVAHNATYLAYGQRLDVDPGILIFDGPIDNPALQITAWRKNQPVEAGVQVSGTVRAPRVELVSSPAVPEGEKLSWLVLGRAPDNATKADLSLLQAAAGVLLPRGNSVPVTRRIARSVGLDELTLRGSSELSGQVVAFGKRLSDRFYISYEQGLGTVASNLVKLDFTLTRRLSLRAETGTSTGLGFFYRYSWD